MISPIVLLLLLLGGVTLATPVPEPQSTVAISRRLISQTAELKHVACESNGRTTRLSAPIVGFAVDELETNLGIPKRQRPSNGPVFYPHEYKTDDATRSPKVHNALNKIGSCMTAVGRTYFEYPVIASAIHRRYTGGDPGAFRVIVAFDGNEAKGFSNPQYCLTVAHESWSSRHMVPFV